MYRVLCACGNEISVKGSQAGDLVLCDCDSTLLVPSLSELRTYAERNEPTPASPVEAKSEDESELPPEFFVHFSGEVSSEGRVSPTAMENFIAALQSKIDAFFTILDSPSAFEVLVSCALLPNGEKIVQVDTVPEEAGEGWAESLETIVQDTTAPPIDEGPVSFVIYKRVGREHATVKQLRPFSRLLPQIEEDGADVALMKAGGLEPLPSEEDNQGPKWWRWLKGLFSFLSSKPPVEDSPREVYERQKAWFYELLHVSEGMTIEQLESSLLTEPDEVVFHVLLAIKYAAAEEWSPSAKSYTEAIHLMPDFALLYGLRARIHESESHSQASLADCNRAIDLAPYEPWFFYQRARIYAELGAWAEAKEDLGQAHELAPRDPDYLLARAGVGLELDQVEQARDDLNQVLYLDPHNGQAHRLIGWIYQETDSYDTNLAVEHFSRAIELMPDDTEPRLGRSLAYASQNKYALALEDCEIALASDSELATAHGIRGRILQMQGDFEDAIEACSRAIELGAESAMVYLTRAICYSATDEPEIASDDCDMALSLDPNNALALHLRGTLSIQSGELDSAMEAFNKASELAPEWTEPREQIALLHRIQENPQAAVDEQSDLVSREPNNPAHYVNRAFAHTELGNFEQAQADFDHASGLDPENEEIIYLRGTFFMRCQEYDLALRDFTHVLSIAEDHDNARLQRATVFLHLKRQDEALEDYTKLIAKHPDDPQAYMGRAYAFNRLGNEREAAKDFQRLMDIVPEESEQMTVNGMAAKVSRLQSEEDYEEALRVASEIVDFAPDNSTGYRLRAAVHWDLEQFVEATDDFSKVLEIEPELPEALSARGQVQAELGEWRVALDDLDQAIDLSRTAGSNLTLAFALNGRALALAGLGRIDESTRDYEESVKLCPSNPWVYFHRGMILFQRGDYAEAEQLLELALQLDDPPLSAQKKQRARTALERARRD